MIILASEYMEVDELVNSKHVTSNGDICLPTYYHKYRGYVLTLQHASSTSNGDAFA